MMRMPARTGNCRTGGAHPRRRPAHHRLRWGPPPRRQDGRGRLRDEGPDRAAPLRLPGMLAHHPPRARPNGPHPHPDHRRLHHLLQRRAQPCTGWVRFVRRGSGATVMRRQSLGGHGPHPRRGPRMNPIPRSTMQSSSSSPSSRARTGETSSASRGSRSQKPPPCPSACWRYSDAGPRTGYADYAGAAPRPRRRQSWRRHRKVGSTSTTSAC
jgi:hypothetical protein